MRRILSPPEVARLAIRMRPDRMAAVYDANQQQSRNSLFDFRLWVPPQGFPDMPDTLHRGAITAYVKKNLRRLEQAAPMPTANDRAVICGAIRAAGVTPSSDLVVELLLSSNCDVMYHAPPYGRSSTSPTGWKKPDVELLRHRFDASCEKETRDRASSASPHCIARAARRCVDRRGPSETRAAPLRRRTIRCDRGHRRHRTAAASRRRGGSEIVGKSPRVGFEPTTYRLTAGRSTVELSGNRLSDPCL